MFLSELKGSDGWIPKTESDEAKFHLYLIWSFLIDKKVGISCNYLLLFKKKKWSPSFSLAHLIILPLT